MVVYSCEHPGMKPTLQCELGARVPLVPRNQWQGGTVAGVAGVPPRSSALELKWSNKGSEDVI